MNRHLIRCANYFGQKYKGVVSGASNILISNRNETISLVGKDLYSTLWNLYHNHNNVSKDIKRITIGGDHSVSIASVAWTLNNFPKSKVIWIDAHADINTYEESKSKNFHGMPLSFLTGLDYNFKFDFIKNRLSLKNLMYVGIRDLDPFEESVIKSNGIKYVNVNDFNKNNFEEIYNFIGDDTYHLSFDVDSIDPTFIPCTGTPVDNGLDLESFQNFFDFKCRNFLTIFVSKGFREKAF